MKPITKTSIMKFLKEIDFKEDQDGCVFDSYWKQFLSHTPTNKDILNLLESTLLSTTTSKRMLIWNIALMDTKVDRFNFFINSLKDENITIDLRTDLEEGVGLLRVTTKMSNMLIDILEDDTKHLLLRRSIATIFTDLEEYEPIDTLRLQKLAYAQKVDFIISYRLKKALKEIKSEGVLL